MWKKKWSRSIERFVRYRGFVLIQEMLRSHWIFWGTVTAGDHANQHHHYSAIVTPEQRARETLLNRHHRYLTTIAGGRAGEYTIVIRDIITISYAAVKCRLTGKPYHSLAAWFEKQESGKPETSGGKPAATSRRRWDCFTKAKNWDLVYTALYILFNNFGISESFLTNYIPLDARNRALHDGISFI